VLLQEALNRQSRPSAEELGLSMDPFTDSMSDLDTLDLRLEYVAAMMKGVSHQKYRSNNVLFVWQLFAWAKTGVFTGHVAWQMCCAETS
jgi:hypothetical protein